MYQGNAKAAAADLLIRSIKGPRLAEEMHSLYKDVGGKEHQESQGIVSSSS